MRLDAKSVAALDLGGKTDVIHFDDALPGFGFRLRAGAGGKVLRSWVVQYRHAGAGRRFLIGSAEKLTAEQARAAAKTVLAKVALGEDPQGDKDVRRSKDKSTFRAVADEYLAFKRAGKKPVRPRTLVEKKRYLTGPYFKPLHTTPIDRITQRDVATRLVTITRQSGGAAAGRSRSALSALFAWAMQSGIVAHNPVNNTPEPDEGGPRERTLTDAELAAIWNASGEDDYGKMIKLLILIPARRSEIGGMCWSELSDDLSSWTLPKERSKNARAHTLPLVPMARAIIDAVPRVAHRDQLFGTRGAGFGSWNRAKAALDQKLGAAVAPFVLHDVRRTVATRMADLGIAPHIIEQILNHQSGHKAGITGVYNKSSYERETVTALAMWADHVRALVESGGHKILRMPVSAT
jgi:integrase